MDGIDFTYPSRAATVVEQLMRSNDVAPEYLLPAIRHGLATLETLLAQRNGKPTNLADDICLFKSILSSIRSIPEEVWQQVFVYLIDRYDPRTLSSLCGVSRKWCSAARSETRLWRYLPPLIVGPAGGSQAAIIENRLETFIRRAGPLLPLHVGIIDPSYTHNPASWSHYRPALSLLISQSQRWSSARITGTVSSLNELQSIQGKLPELTKLSITLYDHHSMAHPLAPAHPSPVFADAPRLRHVILNGRGRQSVSFDLPWLRLETVQSSMLGEPDMTYRSLMDAPPGVSSLKSLDMISNQPSCSFTPQPNTLPALQILRLSMSGDVTAMQNMVKHLSLLTLPALVVFEVFRARADMTYAVSGAILDIIKRSGCSLQRLALDMPLNGVDARSLKDVMCLSPALTHLHLHTFEIPTQQWFKSVIEIREDFLSMLVFDNGDATGLRILPALEVLRVDSTFTSPNFGFDLLRNIIHSRSNPNLSSTGRQLKELQLYSYNMIKDIESLHKLSQIQVSFQLEAPSTTARPHLPDDIVSRWRERMVEDLRQSRTGDRYLGGDTIQLLRTDNTIREMETFDLKEYDTRALAEKGIIPLLHKISASYPDISTYRFSSRARKLCEAWKPYVLRDVGCLPYYWVYFCDGVILKNVHPSVPGKDELLWKDTLGYAGNGIEIYAKPVHLDTLTLKNHGKSEMRN
ncbi:hypothetical protein DFP72DRAFT_908733 [Ephemerocybe angulata]|uniref:F-box domain-containing protein n=1 Tax=Ephemerocybe angulata TaxID=980116 RepID=A0A8H6HQ86_9AGAR|nr:hypothetical protein DFP72DRAFT_908733 [Tulosesus angulatus]